MATSELRILLEREERTEELAFEQLHSLDKCWICLNGSKGSESDQLDPVQTPETKWIQRILKRDEVLQPFLLLFRENGGGSSLSSLSSSASTRGEKVAQLLMQSSCSFCRSVFQTLVRLEEELDIVREGIKRNLKVLVERRKNGDSFLGIPTSNSPLLKKKVLAKENPRAKRGIRPGPASRTMPKRVAFTADAKPNNLDVKPFPQVKTGSEVVIKPEGSEEEFMSDIARGLDNKLKLPLPFTTADGDDADADCHLEDEDLATEDNIKTEPSSDVESDREIGFFGPEIQPDLEAAVESSIDIKDCNSEEPLMHLHDDDDAYSDGNDEDGDYEPEPDSDEDDNSVDEDNDPDFKDTSQRRSSSSSATRRNKTTAKRKYNRRSLSFPKIEDLNNIVCPDCPEDRRKRYSSLLSWKEHYKRAHLDHDQKRQCPYCPKTCNTKHLLQLHLARKHADKADDKETHIQNNITPAVLPIYECSKCGKKLRNKLAWVGHQIVQCGIEVDLDSLPFKIEIYNCPESDCSVKCYTKKSFMSHQKSHANYTGKEKPITCPNNCGQRFTREESVKGHVEFACVKGQMSKRPPRARRPKKSISATNKEGRQCPHCSRPFMNIVAFGKHVKSCRSNPNAIIVKAKEPKVKPKGTCDICQKEMYLVEIPFHKKRIHLKEKRFFCEYCGKGFFARFGLNLHVKTVHVKDGSFAERRKPVLCDICGKEFRGTANLLNHRFAVHMKVVRYKCQVCDMAFYHKNDLRKHFKSHKESLGVDVEEALEACRIKDKK